MEWTVRAARQLPVDGVFVSTDGKEISDHAKDLGATVIDRPAELAGDTTTTEDVLRHAILWINQKHSIEVLRAMLMEATQPLKDVVALSSAWLRLSSKPISSVFLGYKAPFFLWDEEGFPVTYDPDNRGRTQVMKKYFQECGDYLFTVKDFMESNNRICGRYEIQRCNRFAQLDIDDPEDLRFVDAIAREFNLKPAGL